MHEIHKIFKNIPTIVTDRLILRRICKRDIDDIYEYSKNPLTSKYLLWYPHSSISETCTYFSIINYKYKKGLFYDWGIEDKESRKMVGTCGFTRINTPDNNAEIGYVLNPSFWGHGLASEAVKRVLEFGFDFLGFARIEARYIVGNAESVRVMEKCHMQHEGILKHAVYARGEYKYVGICAITLEMYHNLVASNDF